MSPELPLLRVVRGNATEEEIAALVAVLAARAGQGPGTVGPGGAAGGAAEEARNRAGAGAGADPGAGSAVGASGPTDVLSRWADRAALVRAPLPSGPGAWKASARLR